MTEFEPNRQPSESAAGSTDKSSTPGQGEAGHRAEAIHDFTAKLRQPGSWETVQRYIEWQRAQRKALRAGETPPAVPEMAPISINLDLTTACNYACDHCIDWDILNTKDKHLDDELRGSIATMAERGLRSVILIGGGEPTLYPGFVDFVQFLKELDLQVAVVSNGSRNDRILAIAPFLKAGDWVRLSLDSGRNDTFRAMHNPSKKTLDLDEICSWIPKIKAVNSSFELGFSFIITWKGAHRDDTKVVENIGEIVEATKRACEAGFNYISFKPFLERSDEGSEVMHPDGAEDPLQAVLRRIESSVAEARQFERPGFRVMESTNLRVLMQGNWQDFTKQPKTCHMQALRQVLTPTGVFNCPAYRGVARAKIGSKEIYKDPESANRAAARTAGILDNFDASHECREVTCLYHATNWWLEELSESDEDLSAMAQPRAQRDDFL